MDVQEPHRLLALYARALVPLVFVGMGLERLLVAAGLLSWGAPVSTAGLILSALELCAGVAIWMGWRVRLIATCLALFIVIDAFMAHAFWAATAGDEHAQFLQFLKNLSTLGGLLLLAAVHPASRARTPSRARARDNVRLHRPREE
jgi:putative oxidoreductase